MVLAGVYFKKNGVPGAGGNYYNRISGNRKCQAPIDIQCDGDFRDIMEVWIETAKSKDCDPWIGVELISLE